MGSILSIVFFALDILWYIILAHVIMSWLISFGVLNMRQPIVHQIWGGLNRVLEPLYRPIRQALPAMGGIDLAPLVVIFGIYAIRVILINNFLYV